MTDDEKTGESDGKEEKEDGEGDELGRNEIVLSKAPRLLGGEDPSSDDGSTSDSGSSSGSDSSSGSSSGSGSGSGSDSSSGSSEDANPPRSIV